MSITSETKREISKALARGLRALEKPLPLRLSEWAEEHFYLSAESSYIEGRWECLPYQRAVMDCISNDDIRSVTLMKSARVGYTKIIVAAIGYFAEHRQRNQVLFQPVDQDAEDFTKDEIDPMLRDCVAVQRVFPYFNTKSKYNTLSKKVFVGSTLDIRGGKAGKNYRRLSKDVVYYDELSGFDADIQGEGDPVTLGDKRIEGATFPKSVRGSTPKKRGPVSEGGCLIEAEYEKADVRFRFHTPCPHCGHMQHLKWGGKDSAFGFKWANHDPATVAYQCEAKGCGHLFTFDQFLAVQKRGRWIADNGIWIDDDGMFHAANDALMDAPEHVAFHVWTAIAGLVQWSRLVREFIAASKDRSKLKTFVNTTLGETWEEDEGERTDADLLYRRREHYAMDLPDGVQVLTAGIDTQDDRIEMQIDGWGAGEERWTIDYIRLYGDPAQPIIWDKLHEALRRRYRHANGGVMEVMLACQDKGGHYTDEVNRFSKRCGVRFLIPVHGSKFQNRPVALMPRKKDKHGTYGTEVGTDTAKTLLHQRYQIDQPGPGYVHWPVVGPREEVPEPFDRTYFDQVTAEERVPQWRSGVKVMVWDARKRRNEATDCSVYSLAAVRILQHSFGVRLMDRVIESKPVAKPKKRPARVVRSSYLDRR